MAITAVRTAPHARKLAQYLSRLPQPPDSRNSLPAIFLLIPLQASRQQFFDVHLPQHLGGGLCPIRTH